MPRTPKPPRTPRFTPVPRARRHNGWSPERQQAFIDALEDTGSVARAAASIGMSPDGAYLLRRAPGGEEFARAWDEALRRGVHVLVHATMDRAIHGVAVPIMYRGRQVAERRVFSEKLAMFHLRNRLPEEFGAGVQAARSSATGRFVSKAGEQAAERHKGQEEAAEHHRLGEQARLSIRAKLDLIHAHFRKTLAEDPAQLAAYELLYGPGAPGDTALRAGEGVHAAYLAPPLNYIISGVGTDAEVREVFGVERDGENDPAD